MKKLVLSLLILQSSTCFSQRIALIDNNLKLPVLYTDSLTLTQISRGYFPIYVAAYDTLYTAIKYLQGFLSEGVHRAKMNSFELKVGQSVIKVLTVKKAYGDGYDISISTNMDNIASIFKLADSRDTNKSNARKLGRLLAYLKNETSLFKPGYIELEPKQINITVYN